MASCNGHLGSDCSDAAGGGGFQSGIWKGMTEEPRTASLGDSDHLSPSYKGSIPGALETELLQPEPVNNQISLRPAKISMPTVTQTVLDRPAQNNKDFRKALLGNSGMDRLKARHYSSAAPIPAPQKDNEKGIHVVTFSKSEMELYSQDLHFTLVGKFSNGYPALHTIRKEFYKFNLTGEYFVDILNVRHIIIKLSNELDYLTIWGKGMIWMDRFPMRVLKWTTDFNPAIESPILPIWIRMSELSYFLFHKSALWKLLVLLANHSNLIMKQRPKADQHMLEYVWK